MLVASCKPKSHLSYCKYRLQCYLPQTLCRFTHSKPYARMECFPFVSPIQGFFVSVMPQLAIWRSSLILGLLSSFSPHDLDLGHEANSFSCSGRIVSQTHTFMDMDNQLFYAETQE